MSLRTAANFNQYRGNTRTSGPSVEPITAAEVKEQLGIDGADTSEDSLIALYIEAARSACEELFGLALITQGWKMTLDRWPGRREPWWDGVRQGAIGELAQHARATEVIIPRYPLQSVDALTVDGGGQTVTDTFIIDTEQRPGRMVLKFGATLPVISDASAAAIEIDYTAGFGAQASDVPGDLRLALLQMVAAMHAHRGDDCSAKDAMRLSGAHKAFSRHKAGSL